MADKQTELSTTDSARLRRVLDDALPAWDHRARSPVEIMPGSSLRGDADIYPNGIEIAWQGMVSAVDHLKAVRALWLDAGHVHVFADNTILRAALLNASTAVCLLDDSPGVDRTERIRRAGLAALADHRDHLEHQTAMKEMTATLGATATATHQQLLSKIQSWFDRADQVATDHGATKQQRGRGLTATFCIITAGRVTARGSSPDQRVRLESGIRSVWQRGSADAHGRVWQTRTRWAGHEQPGLRADIGELINSIQAVTLVLNEAWRIWDLRSVNHATGSAE